MKKKGQFFLAAALILVSILIGIGGIYSDISIPKEDTRVNQLAKEIKYECAQTLNYAAFQELNSEDTLKVIQSLVGDYSKLNPEVGIFFWFKLKGDPNSFAGYYKNGKEGVSFIKAIEESSKVIIQDSTRGIYYSLSVTDKINNLYIF